MCPTLCYNRDRLQGMKFSAGLGFIVDLDFYLRALMAGAELVGLPEIAYRYRRHPEQVTAHYERSVRMFIEEIELWRRVARESRTRGWQRAAITAERMAIVKLRIGYYALADVARVRPGAALEKLGLLRAAGRGLDVRSR
jgi:hypothetical protein